MIWRTEGEKDFDFNLRGRYQLGLRLPHDDILLKNGTYPDGLSGVILEFRG